MKLTTSACNTTEEVQTVRGQVGNSPIRHERPPVSRVSASSDALRAAHGIAISPLDSDLSQTAGLFAGADYEPCILAQRYWIP